MSSYCLFPHPVVILGTQVFAHHKDPMPRPMCQKFLTALGPRNQASVPLSGQQLCLVDYVGKGEQSSLGSYWWKAQENKLFPNHPQEIWNIPLLFGKSTLLLATKFCWGKKTHSVYGIRLECNNAGETFAAGCDLRFGCLEDKESCMKRDLGSST